MGQSARVRGLPRAAVRSAEDGSLEAELDSRDARDAVLDPVVAGRAPPLRAVALLHAHDRAGTRGRDDERARARHDERAVRGADVELEVAGAAHGPAALDGR